MLDFSTSPMKGSLSRLLLSWYVLKGWLRNAFLIAPVAIFLYSQILQVRLLVRYSFYLGRRRKGSHAQIASDPCAGHDCIDRAGGGRLQLKCGPPVIYSVPRPPALRSQPCFHARRRHGWPAAVAWVRVVARHGWWRGWWHGWWPWAAACGPGGIGA